MDSTNDSQRYCFKNKVPISSISEALEKEEEEELIREPTPHKKQFYFFQPISKINEEGQKQ